MALQVRKSRARGDAGILDFLARHLFYDDETTLDGFPTNSTSLFYNALNGTLRGSVAGFNFAEKISITRLESPADTISLRNQVLPRFFREDRRRIVEAWLGTRKTDEIL